MTARLAALVAATFVSEDLTTIGAGLLAGRGEVPASSAVLACLTGIYVGDLALWFVGRFAGSRVLSWRRVASRSPREGLQQFACWFSRHMPAAIFGSRFAPGTRLPLYIAAGASRTSFRRFAAWSFLAVALWTPLLVGLSAALGEGVAIRLAEWTAIGRSVTAATLLLLLMVWRFSLTVGTRRGRQKLAAAVSRIWRWEFWPMWLFYAPVAVWTAWLALRYRGYHTITAANPGMPDGGVVGESKFDILQKLPGDWVIPVARMDAGEPDSRVGQLEVAMRARGWSYPVVLKPDVGQRGAGVRLVHSAAHASAYFEQVASPVIAQPFHSGPFEAGIFYHRLPNSATGRILCITDKHFPAVVGDGVSTLEDLVWAHPRYRMQARTFLRRLAERRTDVPVAGERVALGLAGNHAQGAMFTDGRGLITTALEARIDEIARAYDGFFIGRFDVRYRDRAAFLAGRDLAIVELNGATAECTNIYDPSSSLLAAYRQLFVQWRLVFRIGDANRRAGKHTTSPRRLLALVRAHLQSAPLPISD